MYRNGRKFIMFSKHDYMAIFQVVGNGKENTGSL